MGSFRPGVVAGGQVAGAVQFGRLLVAGFVQLGSEWCDHWPELLLQSRNVTGSVAQHFARTGKNSPSGDHCSRCRIAAGMPDHLVDPGSLAAIHIAVGSSCCKHYAVVDRKCSKRRIGRARKRKLQIGVESGIEMVGLDSLRMGFVLKEPVD
jgi:hypothetical protein